MEQTIPISNYNYTLPEGHIAKYPLNERHASKLLLFKNEEINQSQFSDLPGFLPKNSLMVMNNTKVVRARLFFKKETGATIEVFCLEPHTPGDYYQSFQSTGGCTWHCMVGNLKKWKEGRIVLELNLSLQKIEIWAEKVSTGQNSVVLRFSWQPQHFTFAEILEMAGKMPIPPYLNRNSEQIDQHRYQTVYAQPEGSVAAPTAGLHFTEQVFYELHKKNIKTETITLHVGAGTFKPVKNENALHHAMHTERFYISKQLLFELLHFEGNITSVGTTTLRALESIYWIGAKLLNKQNNPFFIEQFCPYQWQTNTTFTESLLSIIHFLNQNKIDQFEASTAIMIYPGYEFKVVNRLITNFHQPQSTLLLLVAAFIGNNNWRRVYDFALANNFRFLSYGDSSLLFR